MVANPFDSLMLCHSVRGGTSFPSRVLKPLSVVASENEAMLPPFWKWKMSGFLPTWPSNKTLFNDIRN
jgi:hypothetical protein